MFAQTPAVPPALERIASTPVQADEKPPGLPHVKITTLAADRHLHTLGAVRLDFSNSHTSESASFALVRTHADARRLAHRALSVKTGGLFYTRAAAVGRITVAVAAWTKKGAATLLALAVLHLRRSER